MTIATDSEPGLSVTNWGLGGVDILPLLIKLGGSDVKSDSKISLRVYPTGLKNTEAGKVTAAAWRGVFRLIPYVVDPAAFARDCITWASVDGIVDGVFRLDEVIFDLDGSGKALSMEPQFLQGISYAKPNMQSIYLKHMRRA